MTLCRFVPLMDTNSSEGGGIFFLTSGAALLIVGSVSGKGIIPGGYC